MVGLVLAVVAGAVLLLYGADRLVKARARARWRQKMAGRLAAAASQGRQQAGRREAAAQASKALTSVIPAINHPARSTDRS